jgi:hypothetical protein
MDQILIKDDTQSSYYGYSRQCKKEYLFKHVSFPDVA